VVELGWLSMLDKRLRRNSGEWGRDSLENSVKLIAPIFCIVQGEFPRFWVPVKFRVVFWGRTIEEILELKSRVLPSDHWSWSLGCRDSSIILWIASAWSSSGELLDIVEFKGTAMRFSLS
jgi:hypothetical protein